MGRSRIICVVDDDEEVRQSIRAFFRSAGIVVHAFDAAEALLASPDLVRMAVLITDLHMPGMSGLDLQRALQAQGCRVPVILMTAYPTPEARAEAQDLGIAAFVAKPTDPEALLDRVEELLDA